MDKIVAIIKRAYIVLVIFIMGILLLMMSDHNWKFVYEFIFWALIGTPAIAYAIYRAIRFIFYGK